jgi:radical SAM/Cys-rich protein
VHATLPLLADIGFPPLTRRRLETLQVNLGYRCNQSCVHCHVAAGPGRTEEMSSDTVKAVLAFMDARKVETLDLTGGAPELNPHFRYLAESARAMGIRVVDRCNLTILEYPGQEHLARFLADKQIVVVASLPCYLEGNVDRQRGSGVFAASLRALRRLNTLGYGREGTGLVLDLVFNPQDATLPPPQEELEASYKRELHERFGVVFNHLFTLANMPIQRFGSMLVSKGQFGPYMHVLKRAHSDANLDSVMCRSLLSVDWQGYVYDCDFNQMLGLPLIFGECKRPHISDLMHEDLTDTPIQVAGHCYGCTAGQGSSCQGALKTTAA